MKGRLVAGYLLVTVLALVLGLPPEAPAAQHKAVKLQIQTPYPTSYPYVQRVIKMWQRIKAVTGGQVDVSFFPPGGIVPA